MENEKRLIDADEIYYTVERMCSASCGIEHQCERNFLDLICAAPTMNSVPVWIVHRKDGVYDVYKANRSNWVFSRLSADNIFAWLAEQNLVDIQFVDEEIRTDGQR